MFDIKSKVFNWLFKSQLESIDKRQEEVIKKEESLLRELQESITQPMKSIDESFSEMNSMEVDEFGCERVLGNKYTINNFSTEKYVINPSTHSLIPYKIIEKVMKDTGCYKKYKLSEDFSESSVSQEIMADFMGMYSGSFGNNNYFEWNFDKQRLMFERSQDECQKGVGKAIKDITTNFVLGDGIGFEYTDIKIDDPEIRETIHSALWKIWQDNGFDLKQYTIADFAAERGEVFVKISEDTTKSKYDVEIIDPWEIVDYMYDPNERRVKAWIRDYYRNSAPVTRMPLIVDGGIDDFTNIPYTMHHYKFNVPDTIIRGRSDVYCVLYWIKIYNDFLKCRSRLNRFRSSVAWHKTIEGGTRSIASGATKVQKPFPPGTVLVTDNKTEYKAIDANIQAADVKDDGDAFKIIIASAIQIPHHWLFGSGENTNLATAKNMSAVPKRKFLRRQKDLKNIIQEIFWRGLKFFLSKEKKSKKGLIKTSEGMDLEKLKESISNMKVDKQDTDDEQFEYNGVTLKKKYLDITIPNIDEHNSEDFLRLVNAAAIMRKNGIGSSHSIYDILGINYRKDYEMLTTEVRNGNYEVFRNIVKAFNQFDNAASAGTDANGNPLPATDSGNPLEAPPADANKDGIVDSKENPGNSTSDDDVTTISLSKSGRGGA